MSGIGVKMTWDGEQTDESEFKHLLKTYNGEARKLLEGDVDDLDDVQWNLQLNKNGEKFAVLHFRPTSRFGTTECQNLRDAFIRNLKQPIGQKMGIGSCKTIQSLDGLYFFCVCVSICVCVFVCLFFLFLFVCACVCVCL